MSAVQKLQTVFRQPRSLSCRFGQNGSRVTRGSLFQLVQGFFVACDTAISSILFLSLASSRATEPYNGPTSDFAAARCLRTLVLSKPDLGGGLLHRLPRVSFQADLKSTTRCQKHDVKTALWSILTDFPPSYLIICSQPNSLLYSTQEIPCIACPIAISGKHFCIRLAIRGTDRDTTIPKNPQLYIVRRPFLASLFAIIKNLIGALVVTLR